MSHRHRFFGRFFLTAAALLLAACAPQPTTTPLPPTATVAPTATRLPSTPTPPPTLTATSAPSPTEDAYRGWQVIDRERFSIRLPAGWQALDLTEQNLKALLADLEQYQAVIGWQLDPAEGSQGLDLAAQLGADGDVSHSLNIRHTPLGAQRFEDAQALLAVLAPQVELLGFKVTEQRADLRTDGGLPMARLSYALLPTMKGQPEARGQQYIVLTDTDLWGLTFTAAAGQVTAAPPEFEQAAKSFAPR